MCLVLFFNCLAELLLFRDEAGDGTGFCLVMLHGSLGCHTRDPGGNLTFQCKTLKQKPKTTGHDGKEKRKPQTDNFGPQKTTIKPLWKVNKKVHFNTFW